MLALIDELFSLFFMLRPNLAINPAFIFKLKDAHFLPTFMSVAKDGELAFLSDGIVKLDYTVRH